jgi:hypothetical protein
VGRAAVSATRVVMWVLLIALSAAVDCANAV